MPKPIPPATPKSTARKRIDKAAQQIANELKVFYPDIALELVLSLPAPGYVPDKPFAVLWGHRVKAAEEASK